MTDWTNCESCGGRCVPKAICEECRRISWVRRISSFLEIALRWRSEWAKGKTYLADPDKYPIQTLATDLALAIEDLEAAVAGDSRGGADPALRAHSASPSHQSTNERERRVELENAMRVIEALVVGGGSKDAILKEVWNVRDSSKGGNDE